MKRESKINGFFLCILITILFSSGCMFMGTSYKMGTPIKEDTVKMIQPGKTTKEDIIQWFGIPNVIQKQGEEAASSKQGAMVGMMGPQFVYPSFDLFSSKHKITEDHRIYGYTFTKMEGKMVTVPIIGKQDMETKTDMLLVLVNEKTGIAEDYIFRKENK